MDGSFVASTSDRRPAELSLSVCSGHGQVGPFFHVFWQKNKRKSRERREIFRYYTDAFVRRPKSDSVSSSSGSVVSHSRYECARVIENKDKFRKREKSSRSNSESISVT